MPFAAIKGFLDPSVEFGLHFQEIGDSAGKGQENRPDKQQGGQEEGAPAGKDRGGARPPAEHKTGRPALAAVPAPANSEPAKSEPAKSEPATSGPADAKSADKPAPDEGPDKPAGGGEVVRLDRFRKK